MQVSLQALKAFESAARLGSFKLAGEELSITPTAISHHIANLESRLNINLFQRQVRKIVLTETGEILAREIFGPFRKIEDLLNELQSASNIVKVKTTSSLAAMILIPALYEFAKLSTDISIEVSTGEELDNRLHSLPIRLGNIADVATQDIIRRESFNVFGPFEMDLYAPAFETIVIYTTAWKNKTLIAPPFEKWIEQNNLDPSKFILKTFDQELFSIQEALAGNGLVFCSTTLMSRLVKLKQIRQFPTQSIQSELCYYIPNKESFTSSKMDFFINWFVGKLSE